jgi:GntR family transcriptional regulator, N-acetylglucosamine utilization regulator
MLDLEGLFQINRRSRQPLYSLIEENFHQLILNGRLKSGDLLPSEWELADLYAVSRLTVRHALDNLARQGWLNRRHGVGTFVANPGAARLAPSELSFTQQMLAIGRQPGSRQVRVQSRPATTEIASRLGIQEGDPILEIMRVRLADGEPIMLETSHLAQQRFPGLNESLDLSNASLYEYLGSRYQVYVATMDQTLEPVLLTESEAGYLEAETGSPALYSEVIACTSDGRAIEYSWSVTRGDKCKFVFRLRRGENGGEPPAERERPAGGEKPG